MSAYMFQAPCPSFHAQNQAPSGDAARLGGSLLEVRVWTGVCATCGRTARPSRTAFTLRGTGGHVVLFYPQLSSQRSPCSTPPPLPLI